MFTRLWPCIIQVKVYDEEFKMTEMCGSHNVPQEPLHDGDPASGHSFGLNLRIRKNLKQEPLGDNLVALALSG